MQREKNNNCRNICIAVALVHIAVVIVVLVIRASRSNNY